MAESNNNNYSERYEALFKYFFKGYLEYQSNDGALVFYPGENSWYGARMNALEGFARFFPLAASYMSSTNDLSVNIEGNNYKLSSLFKNAVVSGTNPSHPEYWGKIGDKDQRMVEAADVALGLWLSRDYVWEKFNREEKKQLFNWFIEAEGKQFVDNNWNLFPIMIFKVMEGLGANIPDNIEYSVGLYERYKSNTYKGKGWFFDAPSGFDYYNGWAIHYSLFWLNQIDPDFDPGFIRDSNREFVEFYKYLFSRNGFPMMGRSVCYRAAAPAPIVAGAILSPEVIPPGLALNALDSTWKYFIENNAIKQGKVTQGFFEDDLSLLDGYSGAGSCLWSLRSLIVSFYADSKISLFESNSQPLPIDISDYQVSNKTIGWTIMGNKDAGTIELEIDNNDLDTIYPLIKYGVKNELKELILRRPSRPNNHKALYENRFYSNENLLFQ
ncbi:DUF2264 domain-containing protein [Gelidibacter mesophilus]|uniref:DUF2264 domain-containing protein n=1 Tax=Gelidibacter mesophilus TaxID=169050 RepID=UPI000425A79A|nr:DUF2264 domain-containing protein [Gelidibacter mesophilus]